MKARDIVGLRILEVWQQRMYPPDHPSVVALLKIVLDGGRILTFGVAETENEYAVTLHVRRASRAPKKGPGGAKPRR